MNIVHYKGNTYNAIMAATHSETGEEMVLYQSTKDGKAWVRPASMFTDGRFAVSLSMVPIEQDHALVPFAALHPVTSKLKFSIDGKPLPYTPVDTDHQAIMDFIDLMGASSPDAIPSTAELLKTVYTYGNCVNFAKALKMLKPAGEIVRVAKSTHAVFKINSRYYDVTGEVFPR